MPLREPRISSPPPYPPHPDKRQSEGEGHATIGGAEVRILVPAMLTRSLPLYGNEMIMMLQVTLLASTVTLLEATGVARRLTLTYYVQFEPYVTAAAIYLAMTFVLVSGFQLVQRRFAGYLEHRTG